MEIGLKLLGIIIIAIGIVCVYDARRITNKFFSTSDTNSVVRTMKFVGFGVTLIGSIICFIK